MRTFSPNREETRKILQDNIRRSLENLWQNSPFFRDYYSGHGFSPDQFTSMEDLKRIPFTTRKMLEENFSGMICRPREDWIEVCPTSGTTGKSIYFPMTLKDLNFFADLSERGARALSIDRSDTVQVMLTSDNLLQPSRVMTHMFEENIGALTLRAGPLGHERQIRLMRELKPTVIFGIAPYLLSLGRSFKEFGFNPKTELDLKMLISTGSGIYWGRWEPTGEKREIEKLWQAPYYSILGSTELNAGMWECSARNGHHIPGDYYFAEIIDPKTSAPLKPGQMGELVLTCTGREAIPLIRYRTGDVASKEEEPCPCGLESQRIMALTGRLDQMIKVKGAGIFPVMVEEAVLSVEGVFAYIIEVYTGSDGQDHLRITIDREEESIGQKVVSSVKNRTNLTPEVVFCLKDEINRRIYSESSVKPRKFLDRREKR